MDSDSFGAFCQSAAYISTFDILNVLPSLATLETSRELFSNLSWLVTSNITISLENQASILLNNFTYETITSLPLAKPLAIQCPIPACIFPISGYFTFLQRVLLYINIIIAFFALPVPLLRGVAQIWLTTFWFSVLIMFIATMMTTKVPMIYNLDFQPAVLIAHVGFLPTLLWFSFRAEPGKARGASREDEERNHAEFPHEGEDLDATEPPVPMTKCKIWLQRLKQSLKRAFTEFPVTRLLVPAYGLFDLGNIIMAFKEQNSGGFWPKATAVILSNGTDYLLTSPCYADQSGNVGLWPPAPSLYNGIRNLSSLAIYNPPAGSTAVDALQAIPRAAITSLHVGSVVLCLIIFTLSFFTLRDLERDLEEELRNLLPTSYQNRRLIHYIVILPLILPLSVVVAITIFVIARFEIKAWHLPENEAYTEIGQWGPYVVATVVFAATLMARINGWDFDTRDAGSENRGFGWLLEETLSDAEMELEQAPFIPRQVIAGADGAIDLEPWQDRRRSLRRGSQAV